MPDMPTGAFVRLCHIQRRMSTVSLATGLLSVYKRGNIFAPSTPPTNGQEHCSGSQRDVLPISPIG